MFTNKQLTRTSEEEEVSQKIGKCLKNLEPVNKHIEDIQAKRVGYAISRAAENVKFASIIARICDRDQVNIF